ncbi:glutamyl-tRNA(Gln) amidotransferase subunit A [Fusarium mundagurra]|uniref:Glutamyl-tRNA(Gln) amidotransferase subunit A n=1 Tax=Fusarium mundagurra TaxID=1567541 RepID=A0A8H5YAF0_9HYPO|nr:glutamyl-tRNA(Gln) amidotransferase subunit A [Fusarium mundagurra]
MRFIAFLSLALPAVAELLRPNGISLSLNGTNYFLSPSLQETLPKSLIPTTIATDSLAFVPITIVGNNTAQADLPKLFKSWAQKDDVWQPAFSELVILLKSPRCKSTRTTFNGIKSAISCWQKAPEIASGPYFLDPYRGSLHQVYRLYDDFSGSFLESILQSPDGTFETLSAHAPGSSSLTLGVPSRLYFTRTKEKPLAGVRVGVKDLYDLKGVRSSRGNRAWYNLYLAANKTAPAIQNLIDAGAVIVGTQKLSQFANGENPTADWVSYLAPFNPRGDGYQGPSSSSSGAGASVASYPWLDLAVGSDTGGSIRGPAGVSGVFGNRPTHGLVSLDHVLPLSPKMDTAGFLTRDPEIWSAAQAAMYKKNYTTFSKERVKYPRTVYTAGFPANDTPEGAILHQFANDLADFLTTNLTEYNISEHWASEGPKSVRNTPLTELLNVTYATLITKQQIALVKEPFFRDYAAAHDGRKPYIDPAPSARWAWGESQPDSLLDDAIHNKTIFMDWFNDNVLPKDKDSQRCSSNILLYTQGPGIFSRRDVYLDPPSVPFGWSLSRISIFSEAPDSVYPIGEVSQFSDITGRNESLPVSVNIMVARGCDGLVPRLAQDLVGLGLLKIPKTGGSTSGGSILF